MTRAFSWQNSVRLWPASFCTLRPNLPVTPGIPWLPTFAFQCPIMKRTSFLGVSSRNLVGLHRTIQLQLLQHYWLGHRLGLLWYWTVCLGDEQRSFSCFWDCIQLTVFWTLLLTMMTFFFFCVAITFSVLSFVNSSYLLCLRSPTLFPQLRGTTELCLGSSSLQHGLETFSRQ